MRFTLISAFFCTVFGAASLQAQNLDTVRVYFDTDVSDSFDPTPIDSAWRVSTVRFKEDVRILGYADFIGGAGHNDELAKQRAQTVAKYILRNGSDRWKVVQVKGFGEVAWRGDSIQGGIARDRRVDIVITHEHVEIQDDIINNDTSAFDIDTVNGSNFVLEGMTFIPGRHYPLPEAQPSLDRLIRTMKQYPWLRIEIQGFICCDYSAFDGLDNDTQLMNLSEARAKFIYDYLVDAGIDPERMRYVGYGSTRPVAFPEVTEADRQANRRVEIKVLK